MCSVNVQGIGFLSDGRRLNVALTRARFGLVVLGNPRVLARHSVWAALLAHFRIEDALVEGPLTNLKKSMVQLARPRALLGAGSIGQSSSLVSQFRPVERAGQRHEHNLPRRSGVRQALEAQCDADAAPVPLYQNSYNRPATQSSLRSQSMFSTQASQDSLALDLGAAVLV